MHRVHQVSSQRVREQRNHGERSSSRIRRYRYDRRWLYIYRLALRLIAILNYLDLKAAEDILAHIPLQRFGKPEVFPPFSFDPVAEVLIMRIPLLVGDRPGSVVVSYIKLHHGSSPHRGWRAFSLHCAAVEKVRGGSKVRRKRGGQSLKNKHDNLLHNGLYGTHPQFPPQTICGFFFFLFVWISKKFCIYPDHRMEQQKKTESREQDAPKGKPGIGLKVHGVR